MTTTKPTIAIIDDCRDSLIILTAALKHQYNIIQAEDGNEFLAKLADLPQVDLIITDISMPGMDGIQLKRNLELDLMYRSVPIFALTAYTDDSFSNLLNEEGFKQIVNKPVSFADLKIRIIEELAKASVLAS